MKKFNLIIVCVMILLLASMVLAFKTDSSSFSGRAGTGSAAQTNASSTSFGQRFIAGIAIVGNYVSSSFTGVMGLLSDETFVAINMTYPLNNQEVVRGGTSSNEDTESLVSDLLDITARVYNNNTYILCSDT